MPASQALKIETHVAVPMRDGTILGFDHGVGHSLLALCDAKAPRGQKRNEFKALRSYLFNIFIGLF